MAEETKKVEMTAEEILKKTEDAVKQLEAASAKMATQKAEMEILKAQMMLGGQAEAGTPPVKKTSDDLLKEDLQSIFPASALPKKFR